MPDEAAAPKSPRQTYSTTVRLNVYDLAETNNFVYWCGFGAFHTGVEVYDVEYAFGGHSYDVSGLFATEPKNPPGNVVFRESIEMGTIQLSPNEVHSIVASLGQEYKGNKYHLLSSNCNHFADDLCFQLTGKRAPGWINRLAGMASILEVLLPSKCLPPLTPPAPPESEVENLLFQAQRGRPKHTQSKEEFQQPATPPKRA